MENKTNKGIRAILALILVLVLCSTAGTVVTVLSQLQIKQQLNEVINKDVDTGAEDDVVIAGEYTIRSTLAISDAYKNGAEDTLSDRDKETLDMAKKVLDDVVKEDMSDYEKEESVYLWLTKEMKADTGMLTVIPTSSAGADDPHDVLKNRNAVCVGYATTFRLLMQMLDIECKVVHNKELFHSWNLVELDGEWYHVDCYSDADNGNYMNFNMNDTRAEDSHDWNRAFFPAATGIKYSYAAMHSVELKNIYAIPKAIRKMFDKEQDVAAFTFKQRIEKDDEPQAVVILNTVRDYLNSADNFYVDMQWSESPDGGYVLSVYINRYNKDDTPKLEDDIMEKINSAVTDAFGDFDFGNNYGYDEPSLNAYG